MATVPDAVAADAPAAAEPPAPREFSEREKKRFLQSCARKDYIGIMKQVNKGMPPNTTWKNLLPMRTAVLASDVDMVALLRIVGADPNLEPTGLVEATDDEPARVIKLGKSARGAAQEIAGDMANPLQREASQMLIVMDNLDEAKRRVHGLQAKIEQDLAEQRASASRNIVFFIVLLVLSFVAMHYLKFDDDGGDTKEL